MNREPAPRGRIAGHDRTDQRLTVVGGVGDDRIGEASSNVVDDLHQRTVLDDVVRGNFDAGGVDGPRRICTAHHVVVVEEEGSSVVADLDKEVPGLCRS